MPERRRRILEFIQEFYSENGIPPTVRDIQQACDISSTSVVDYNLRQLEEAGYLNRRREVARGIELLDRDGEPVSSAPRVQIVGSIAAGQPLPVFSSEGAVASEEFELAVESLGSFGGKRPRAVWAGIAPSKPLTALRRRVESALVRAGLPPEERKFTPHITVARTAGARPAAVAAWLEDRGAFRLPGFAVESFSLMSSRLGGEAPVYREEVRYPFGGEAFAP